MPPTTLSVRRQTVIVFAFLSLFFLFLVFLTPQRELLWDDAHIVEDLPRNLWDLPQWLSLRYWVSASHALFRPLVSWTMAMNREVGGAMSDIFPSFNPAMVYRVFNIFLHSVSTFLLFCFAKEFSQNRLVATIATILFGVHAFHAEALGLAVNRSELLGFIFGMLFLMQHRSGRYLSLVSALLVLALASKESAVVWICVALFLDLAERRLTWKQYLFSYPIYIALCVAWFFWHAFITDGQRSEPYPGSNPLLYSSLWERLPSVLHAQVRYLQNLVFPESLISSFEYPLIHRYYWTDPRAIIGLVVFPLLAWFLVQKGRWRTKLGQSVICYGIIQAPMSSFLVVVGPLLAERLCYSSSAFFTIAVSYVVMRLHSASGFRPVRIACSILAGTWFLAHASVLAVRLSYWRDAKVFFTNTAAFNPESGEALCRYTAYLERLDPRSPDLVRHSENALKLFPTNSNQIEFHGKVLVSSSTEKAEFCRGYDLLKTAFFAEPQLSSLPKWISNGVRPGGRRTTSIEEELRLCGIDFPLSEAQAIEQASMAQMAVQRVSNGPGYEDSCGDLCMGIRQLKRENFKLAANYFMKSWNADTKFGYQRAYLLWYQSLLLRQKRPVDIFLGRLNFSEEWAKYCAKIGYITSNSCRISFKIGIDGIPWAASPLKGETL